jgi:hypothetical protein
LYGDTYVSNQDRPYYLFTQYLLEEVTLINSLGFKARVRGRKGITEVNCRWDHQDRHFRATESTVRNLITPLEAEDKLLEDELSVPTVEKEAFKYNT